VKIKLAFPIHGNHQLSIWIKVKSLVRTNPPLPKLLNGLGFPCIKIENTNRNSLTKGITLPPLKRDPGQKKDKKSKIQNLVIIAGSQGVEELEDSWFLSLDTPPLSFENEKSP